MEKKSSPKQAADKQATTSQSKSASKSTDSAKKGKLDASVRSSHSRTASETGKKS